MTQDTIIDLVRGAVLTIILVASPPLIMGLSVGILVSIFQTVTSIQEQTLAFIPKILAVLFSLLIFGSFMLMTLERYIVQLYNQIPELLIPK